MKIRLSTLLMIVVLAGVSLVGAGEIQVLCEPGLRVYLDGSFAGLSNEREDGLYLMDLEDGKHRIWVEKDGCLSQHFEIELGDLPAEITVGKFEPVPTPGPTATDEPAAAEPAQFGGDLIITSAPQKCTVEIDGETRAKESPHLVIGGLSAGKHRIVFSKAGFDSISRTITIEAGSDLRVRGNLKDGRVEIVHEGMGSLRLFSKPMVCRVLFRGKTHDKTGQRLNISKIPAGEYPIVVHWRGMERSTVVPIRKGRRTVITVSFMEDDEPWVVSSEPE